jgi:hypothetical protein
MKNLPRTRVTASRAGILPAKAYMYPPLPPSPSPSIILLLLLMDLHLAPTSLLLLEMSFKRAKLTWLRKNGSLRELA